MTIEDMPELIGLPHPRGDLFYSKGGQSVANTTAEDLVEAALRMGMDGLLNQELRDEAAYAYLYALESGHWGMTTTHADSAGQARDRIRGLIKKHPAGRHLNDADVMIRYSGRSTWWCTASATAAGATSRRSCMSRKSPFGSPQQSGAFLCEAAFSRAASCSPCRVFCSEARSPGVGEFWRGGVLIIGRAGLASCGSSVAGSTICSRRRRARIKAPLMAGTGWLVLGALAVAAAYLRGAVLRAGNADHHLALGAADRGVSSTGATSAARRRRPLAAPLCGRGSAWRRLPPHLHHVLAREPAAPGGPPGEKIPAPRRALSDAHGSADWMSMEEARTLFPGPHPAYGGVVVGEAYRVDRDKVRRHPVRP